MSLADLASIGSFVSGVAVLVSLLFLYFQLRQIGAQVRQAERNQKAAITQGRTNRMVDLALRMAEPALTRVLSKSYGGADDLGAEELFQVSCAGRAILLNAEDTYYQYANGLIEDGAYKGYVNAIKNTLALPTFRLGWMQDRALYGPEFGRFIDGLIAETPMANVGTDEHVAQWNAAIRSLNAAG